MKQEELASKSDREILVDLRIETALLCERTEGLPDMKVQVSKNVNDIGWLKKLLYAVIPGIIALVALLRFFDV